MFYLVLISRAAAFSFSTLAACILAVMVGLGVTLLLLAVYRKALPALPISIGLGVICYAATRFLLIPYHDTALAGGLVLV